MRLKGGATHLGYHVHDVVDGGNARIVRRFGAREIAPNVHCTCDEENQPNGAC